MTKEMVFLVLYLFGIQPVLYGYFLMKGYDIANVLLTVGTITTGVLGVFFLSSLLFKKLGSITKKLDIQHTEMDTKADKENKENETERGEGLTSTQKYHQKPTFLRTKVHFFSTFLQRYLLGIALYVLTALIAIYPFVVYSGVVLVFLVALMVKVLLASFLLYKGKIYVYRRLLVAKDIVLLLSVWLWAFAMVSLRSFERYVGWGIASLVGLLFSWIIIKGGGLLKHYSIRRLGLVKMYGVLFLVSLVGGVVMLYKQVDELLVSSFDQKLTFMWHEIKQEVEKVKTLGLSFSLRNIFGREQSNYRSEEEKVEQKKQSDDFNVLNPKTGQRAVFLSGATGSAMQVTGGVKKDFFPGDKEKEATRASVSSGAFSSHTGSQSDTGFVTYRKVLRHLFAQSQLAKTPVSFTYITKNDPDYWYFVTAYKWGMIGKTVKPDAYVLCDTYIVMKGIRRGRKVYVPNPKDPFTPYRQKASQLGQLNGCQRGKYVKKTTL